MDALQFSHRGLVRLVLSLLVSTEIACAGILYVDANGVTGYPTIASAVDVASSGDTVVVRPGTYRGSGNTNVRIEDKSLTIRSTDPNDSAVVAATVVDCSMSDAEYCRAFSVTGVESATDVTIAGLTLINGARTYQGGAVLCIQAGLTLTNCVLRNNAATGWGGGLYLADSTASLRGCTFRGNVSEASFGGALCCRNSVLDIRGCRFESNTGGAVQAYESSLSLNQCSFLDNVGDKGAAVYSYVARDSIPRTYLIVNGGTFARNGATLFGGALCLENVSTAVSGSIFTANVTKGDGGAIYNTWTSPALSNCVFAGNSATATGGAVANWNQSCPTIVNCTFVGNQAGSGGVAAANLGGTTLFRQCILWNNTAAKGKNLYVGSYGAGSGSAAMMTVQYCDVQSGKTSAAVDAGCTLDWGQDNLEENPLFIWASGNDYHLSCDSPCIDTGDPKFDPADEVDLDGSPRVFGSLVDLGAFEFQGRGPVYRFWSASQGTHFYTLKGSERDKLISQYAQQWRFEGIAFYAYFKRSETNLTPVYRFWSPLSGAHMYTTSDAEKEKMRREMSKDWWYEGVVFYTYPERKQPANAVPVYRFASLESADHFYTVNEDEKDELLGPGAGRWVYEGVAWYAFSSVND